jgi:YjgF/chorismate_mutase-like, putative endoribonuclease
MSSEGVRAHSNWRPLRSATGSLDKVVRFGRVFGMVNAAPDFTEHPKVIDGCSVEVLGDRSRHGRYAVGMGSLPFDMTVVQVA